MALSSGFFVGVWGLINIQESLSSLVCSSLLAELAKLVLNKSRHKHFNIRSLVRFKGCPIDWEFN